MDKSWVRLKKLRTLRKDQDGLKIKFKLLLIEYQEYQHNLKKLNKSESKTDDLFSLYHQSLMSRIKENKKLRNEISIKLKEIKKLIKQVENEDT